MRAVCVLPLVLLVASCGPAAGPSLPSVAVSPMPTSCHSPAPGMPDPVCTPGATNPAVTQANIVATICVSGYTSTIRPPTSYTDPLKLRQMAAYGLQGQLPSDFELDHLVPLEAGGNPSDPANLWPMPYSGPDNAHLKDQVENMSHAAICAGRITLADAQQGLMTDWRVLGRTLGVAGI